MRVMRPLLPLRIAVFTAVLCSALVNAQSTRPSHSARQSSPIQNALAQLIREAQQSRRDQQLLYTSADFAKRFMQEVPGEDVIAAILKPAHQDSFVDAYVRWQLTSFNPDLPKLDDSQFLKLMASAPPMIENPRADQDMVATFQQAEKADHIHDRELARLRSVSAELNRRTSIAQSLNAPAEGYRDWIADHLPKIGPRRTQWLIERCAATIQAGWPSRNIKAKMTKEFKAASTDGSISLPQRDMIARQARRLIGLKRTAINEITFPGDGSVNVTTTTPAIDEDDVNKWIGSLNAESKR